jgi:hypothetical protein
MKHLSLVPLFVLSTATAHAAEGDIVKTNDAARVANGQTAADVRTTTGLAHLGDGSRVQSVTTTNGRIEMGDGAATRELRSTNGAIAVGARGHVSGDAMATNGRICLGRGSVVDGKVSSSNGSINLDGAHVAGGIETRSGGVTIGPGSEVEGGVSDHAKIGPAKGATAKTFSGDSPMTAFLVAHRTAPFAPIPPGSLASKQPRKSRIMVHTFIQSAVIVRSMPCRTSA